MEAEQKSIQDQVIDFYRGKIEAKHKELIGAWPILSGCNSNTGSYKNWVIIIYTHTGVAHVKMHGGFGELTPVLVGVGEITVQNKESVRKRLEKHFRVGPHDGIVFLENKTTSFEIHDDIDALLKKHEYAMGVVPMRIFLSHKGADKPLVREYKATLTAFS